MKRYITRAGGLVGSLEAERNRGACGERDRFDVHGAVALARRLGVDLEQLPTKMREAIVIRRAAVQPFLREVYELAVKRAAKVQARAGSGC